MEIWILLGILALNVAISWWNCYAVGSVWKEIQAFGGFWYKALAWSAAVQSAVGFSMAFLLPLAFGTAYFASTGEEPYLNPEETQLLMQGTFQLWYVAVIIPAIGTGIIIWMHSIREAIREQSFGNVAAAAWNTYAMYRNISGAATHLGDAASSVGDLLGSVFNGRGDAKGKVAMLMILIVVLAIAAGIALTYYLINMYSRRSNLISESEVREHLQRA